MIIAKLLIVSITLIGYTSACVESKSRNNDSKIKQIFSFFQDLSSSTIIQPGNQNNNLTSLNDFAQRNFLRPKDAERYDKKSILHYKNLCSRLTKEEKLKY